jgi:hypothetical protein
LLSCLLRQWFESKVKFVRGIDLSDQSIETATERYEGMKRPHIRTVCEFETSEMLGQGTLEDPKGNSFLAIHPTLDLTA